VSTELRNVFLLDPRGIVVSGGKDTIDRQSTYGLSYNRLKGNSQSKFILISSGNSTLRQFGSTSAFTSHIVCKPTFNFVKFASLASKLIKRNNLNVSLLIAGDPWESFWSAYFLRIFLRIKVPIQIHVHGDIADLKWRRLNVRNRMRFYLAHLSLKRADGIRAVSSIQGTKLINVFNIDPAVIVVIPVPIGIQKVSPKFSVRPKTLGFIGRIHRDRGLTDFLEFIKKLNSVSKDFKVIIAGSGPEESKFLRNLSLILPSKRIVFHGQIPNKDLKKIWKEVGVLVSMAPSESYGRVLRESLLSGVPVWASASSGVLELKKHWNKDSFEILELDKSSDVLLMQFLKLLEVRVKKSDKERFIKANNSYSQEVGKSWTRLIADANIID
jgi:glycosyltransferase involved in cell wall biosynthesis